jgi:ELWxxDGT repeat protein
MPDRAPDAYADTPDRLRRVNGRIVFHIDDELWSSDGTAAGAAELHDAAGGEIQELEVAGRNAYFVSSDYGRDGFFGHELWRTDGTPAGTSKLAELGDDGQLVDVDPARRKALILRTSDGWEYEAVDLRTGAATPIADPQQFRPRPAPPNGERFYFTYDRTRRPTLWHTDGTTPRRLRQFAPHELWEEGVMFRGRFYFRATTATGGDELWVSDGTPRGTVMLANIARGGRSSHPNHMRVVNGRLTFCATDPEHGASLWTTDGTRDGTRWLQTVGSQDWHLGFDEDVVVGRLRYFHINRSLWKTDGAPAGTALVGEFYGARMVPGPFYRFGDDVIFVAQDAEFGTEWRIDRDALAK